MSKTANLFARIEPDVKQKAENILNILGIPASVAIDMFYKQIILHQGIPFDVKVPEIKVLDASKLTKEEMDAELEKGYQSMLNGEGRPAKEVFAELRREFDL